MTTEEKKQFGHCVFKTLLRLLFKQLTQSQGACTHWLFSLLCFPKVELAGNDETSSYRFDVCLPQVALFKQLTQSQGACTHWLFSLLCFPKVESAGNDETSSCGFDVCLPQVVLITQDTILKCKFIYNFAQLPTEYQ